MATATKIITLGADWQRVASAESRDSMLMIDAAGMVQVAIADGEAPPITLTSGHSFAGPFIDQIKGAEFVWARGDGISIAVTLLQFKAGFESTASARAGVTADQALAVAQASYGDTAENRAAAEAAAEAAEAAADAAEDAAASVDSISARVDDLEGPFEASPGDSFDVLATDSNGAAIIIWRSGEGGGLDAHLSDELIDRIASETTGGLFEVVEGDQFEVLMTDSDGSAIVTWNSGESGGLNAHISEETMDRIGEYLGSGGGGGDDGALSTTAIEAIGVNGQSLSVGGEFLGAAVTRAELMAVARPGAALLVEGTVRGDNVPITTMDMPRSQAYNPAVPATGLGQANPSTQVVSAAWPLATAINEYRKDLGLPMVPVTAQCHGVSGIQIENIDDDPATGTPGLLTVWNNLTFWHQQAKAVADTASKTISVPWHYWVHGTSAKSYAANSYLDQLWNYKDDMQALMKTLGLTGPARMLVSQSGGNTTTQSTSDPWHVVDEQLQFCEAGGGVLATPEYAYEIADNVVHPDAHATVQFAEVAARAAAEVEAGRPWTIHRPKASVVGNVLTLNFDRLRPGEYLVQHDPARYGGQGIDSYLGFEAVGTTITALTIRGQTVIITCAAPPTGVRYAYQKQDVSGFAGNRWNAHRGLLRTSEEWEAKLLPGVMLYRWIPSFKITF